MLSRSFFSFLLFSLTVSNLALANLDDSAHVLARKSKHHHDLAARKSSSPVPTAGMESDQDGFKQIGAYYVSPLTEIGGEVVVRLLFTSWLGQRQSVEIKSLSHLLYTLLVILITIQSLHIFVLLFRIVLLKSLRMESWVEEEMIIPDPSDLALLLVILSSYSQLLLLPIYRLPKT